jgi:hypothetical protein
MKSSIVENSLDMVRIFIPVLIFVVMISCGQRPVVSAQELSAYISDVENGLKQQTTKSGIDISVTYRPTDFIVAQEVAGEGYTQHQIDSIKASLQSIDYFMLSLSKKSQAVENYFTGNEAQFNTVIEYLSFKIGKDLSLVHGPDTIPAKDFMYAQGFGSTKSSDVLVAFESNLSDRDGELTFLFDDSIFKTGLNQFQFSLNDIHSTPLLRINP